MQYGRLAEAYTRIESTSGLLEKTEVFSLLLKEAEPAEVSLVVALTMGKLHPDWLGAPEIGVAEKMAIQVVAIAASVAETAVREKLRRTGDIGAAAESLLSQGSQGTLFGEEPTVKFVYDTLDAVSKASGQGSSREKIAKLVGLVSNATPLEAKYILRTVTGDLRLGMGDMIIVDSLAAAYVGEKGASEEIERAFNVCSDLAHVADLLAQRGMGSIRSVKVEVGTPIRMMAAKKLSSSSEILERLNHKALVEFKYDGERVQVHKNGDQIVLFSRRQERITDQYPDVVELVRKSVRASRCVIEGECVAIDLATGKMRPFQELMRRRRKTDIDMMKDSVPVALFFFDILYLENKDVTDLPMLERRSLLEKVVKKSDRVSLTNGELIDDPERLDEFFKGALDRGVEGIIAKAIHKESSYQAGSRSWLWVKMKPSYQGLSDALDLVVVGAIYGRGKRTGVYGAILASVYDPDSDTYPTACKIGTGFTEEMLTEFKQKLEKYVIEQKHPKVVADIKADVWFDPQVVIEVIGDSITGSPTHPAGRGRIRGSGLAVRFPRFTGRWRDDKAPTQATTVDDLVDTFESQRGR